ncbi:GNAT family N-acetyltransferase [Streptomyces sp. NPDC050619]|uniref:GNAT family N-acetyltransferase n=1 Tax=Streptomyces sp. NPDC050619 TaxID=3157214 RepID=UPI0034488557
MNGITASGRDSATELVLLEGPDTLIGRLRFRTCVACRTGRILDVWVLETWQRQGLGRELVHGLLARFPDHRWSTTSQTREGRAFFAAMTRETSIPFPHRGPLCTHLSGRMARAWHALAVTGRSARPTRRGARAGGARR